MNRRHALAALSLFFALALAPSAQADMAPPPITLHVEGQPGSVTGAAPDHAVYRLRNVTAQPVRIYLYRVIVLDGGSRIPLPVDAVEVGGRAVGRTVTVPANGELRVTVRFAMPSSLHGRASYSLELSHQANGHGASDSRPAVHVRSE